MKKSLIKSLALIPLTISPIAAIFACSNPNNSSSEQLPPLDQVPTSPAIIKSGLINRFNSQKFEITARNLKRQINQQIYQTKLNQQYNNQLKYPGWNYNYEQNNQWQQTIDGKVLNLQELVYDETTDFKKSDGKLAGYNDPEFILNEIANQQLKVHPAAKLWFKQPISDDLLAITKSFSISSLAGPTALGLYLPAGEVATLTFDQKTLNAMVEQNINNFEIIINNSFWDNTNESGNSGNISNRYPFVKTIFQLDVNQLKQNGGQFQFGSPFGGTISVKVNQPIKAKGFNTFMPVYTNFDFSITNAIETLFYQHGSTTEQNWNQQINDVLANKIQAPAMAIDFGYGSAYIQSTDVNQFAYQAVADIPFLAPKMNKWNDFLIMSQYFASRDLNHDLVKLDMEFNDDIWGGAIAWGGGNALFADLNQARSSFLTNDLEWNIRDNWGLFHEINHNFQQDAALFNKREHGETNQVSMVNLSILSDSGRWRNLWNISSNFTFDNWSEYQNNFSVISRNIIGLNYQQRPEYDLQNLLLWQLGTWNFTDYVRHDIATNPNTGGFKEIVELSDYFKINFWPALSQFSSIYNDGWPATYDQATSDQKQIIDRLNKDYLAFDFVANLFASGTYLWDRKNNQYVYTNDMQAPIAINAFEPYVFDFNQAIKSANPKFKWDQLKISATSKLGAQLEVLNDGKTVVYHPAANTLNQSDEFDIEINNANATDPKAKYVPGYRWKIKVDLVANLPKVSVYQNPHLPVNKSLTDHLDYLQDKNNFAFSTVSNVNKGLLANYQDQQNQLVKIDFNFIPPVSGTFQTNLSEPNSMIVFKDDNLWKSENQVQPQTISIIKNQPIHFEIYTLSNWTNNQAINFTLSNDQKIINIFDSVTVSNLPVDINEAFEFKYHSRQLDLNQVQGQIFPLIDARPSSLINKVNANGQTNYQFVNPSKPIDDFDNKLTNPNDGHWFEDWGSKPYQFSFDVQFNQATTINTILITHELSNWHNGRPTQLKISDKNQNVIYDQAYTNRQAHQVQIALDQAITTDLLHFEIINDQDQMLLIDSIQFSSQPVQISNRLVNIFDPMINLVGTNLATVTDDRFAINGCSLKLTGNNQGIEFKIKANGFDLLGTKWAKSGNFSIIVDEQQPIEFNAKTNPNNEINNVILASINLDPNQIHKIKIITNDQDATYLFNGLQTYGKNVKFYSN